MNLEIFKPGCFKKIQRLGMNSYLELSVAEQVCVEREANKILNEYIESLPIVYFEKPEDRDEWWHIGKQQEPDDTHKAYMIIEPIKEKEKHEMHEPDFFKSYRHADGREEHFCKICKKKIKAKWEVDE